jgi:hypothetical protein
MTEPTDVTIKPEAPAPPPTPPPSKPAPPAAAPARALPSPEEISEWIHGADLVTLGALFEGLPVAKFDVLVLQVRKEELIPQHWQVLTGPLPEDDLAFERLPEVGKLRVRYKDQELARKRVAQLLWGWRELRGKRPALWSVSDLFAAMRRIIEKKYPINWTEFLTAQRDVWRELTLPFGREQLEVLWACLVLIRKNTKK